MASRHLPFLDWMKVIGLAVIVYGHVAAASSTGLTPPIYPKQLGVAFFVFATGFTLAGEWRRWQLVLFRRMFDVLLFGFMTAVIVSIVGFLRWNDLSESNYLPLVLGLNLVLKEFPANPTTWYIGTYLHLLLLWALAMRRLSVTTTTLAAVTLTSIAIRTLLVLNIGPYTAYMAFTNWMDVLLFGMMVSRTDRRSSQAFAGALAFVILWPALQTMVDWQHTFPFMTAPLPNRTLSALIVSALVSLVYLGYTWAAFTLTQGLPSSPLVSFFARNTVIVFIGHMPVYYVLEFMLEGSGWSYLARTTMEFTFCFGGLAVVSELVQRVIRPHLLRDVLERRLVGERRVLSEGVRH